MRRGLVLSLLVGLPFMVSVWLAVTSSQAVKAEVILPSTVINTVDSALTSTPLSPKSARIFTSALTTKPIISPRSTPTFTPAPTNTPQTVRVGALLPSTVINTVNNTIFIEGAGYVAPVWVEIVNSSHGLLGATIGGNGISLVLPTGFPAGTYHVLVYNGDGTTGTATNALTVLSPTPTSTSIPPNPTKKPKTPAPTDTPVPTTFLRPLLIVQSYAASSTTLRPGQKIDFEMTLQSTGATTARNIVVTFERGDLVPRETGGVHAIRDLVPGDAERFWQPFAVDSNLSNEVATLNVLVEYTDERGTKYTGSFDLTFPATLPVATATATPTPLSIRPRIIVESYRIDPHPLYPGAIARLYLELVNASGETARQVVTSLELSPDNLEVLAPLSSNQRFTEQLDPAERVTLPYDLAVAGDAGAGLISVNVLVSYSDDYNNTYQDTNVIGLRLEVYPAFLVTLYQSIPDIIRVGDTFDLPVMVTNIGRNEVNVSTIEVTSDQFRITEGVLYLGPLYASTSGSLLAQAEALKAGTATVTVTVNYLDDYQRPQKYTHELTFEVQEVRRTGGGSGTVVPGASGARGIGGQASMTLDQRLLQALLGFFGLATRTTPGFGGGIPQRIQP